MSGKRALNVAIIGAGMSGICMAAKLQDAGIDTFTIFESADEVGGTWRDNTYPGLTCDVPSRFYSYSFRPNSEWSRLMSPGPEIQSYFSQVATERGIRPHIRFGTEVTSARYRDGQWWVGTSDGEEAFDVLIAATGVLRIPRYPDIPGLETFAGPSFHSSRWDHSVSLPDKRIGLIGTGSTGVQITAELGGNVKGLKIFQRTPQWVFPTPNLRYSAVTKAALQRWPVLNKVGYRFWQFYIEHGFGRATVEPCWQRRMMTAMCRWNLRLSVRDPELRRKLTPDYHAMCKRQILAGHYYQAVQKPGVHLVSEAIDHVEPKGVVTVDGRLHELDLLVLATGFDARAYVRPMDIVGENGLTLERGLGRRAARVPLRSGAGLSEPVHVDGPALADRQPVAGDHRREPGRLRDVVDQPDPRWPYRLRGADRGGHQGLQREHESRYAPNGLGHRMQELVPGQGRPAGTVSRGDRAGIANCCAHPRLHTSTCTA